MKHSLLHIALVFSFVIPDFTTFTPLTLWNYLFNDQQENTVPDPECNTSQEEIANSHFKTTAFLSAGPAAQETDSMALVAIFNATNNFIMFQPWTIPWDVNDPVCTWHGVTLDSEGYVTHLDLTFNNLQNSLPEDIGDLSRLEELLLGDNCLSGPIPSDIGNCIELKILKLNDNDAICPGAGFSSSIPSSIGNLVNLTTLWLDGNELSGPVPSSLGSLTNLINLFITDNELSGSIPATFVNLMNLQHFELQNNNFDGLPDLSTLTALIVQNNRFKVQNNALTFDDILPNIGTSMGDNYHPQDSFFTHQTVNLQAGDTYQIDLGIDATVPDNNYLWFKNSTFYPPVLNTNILDLSPISFADAGVYCCEVTNPNAPLLTLYSRCVTINVTCGESIEIFNPTLCTGQTVTINGVIYGESPLPSSGTDDLIGLNDLYGCDTSIVIDLSFTPPVVIDSTDTLCPGESVTINGTVYDEDSTDGTETISGGPGCDTTINVEIFFYTLVTGSVSQTICENDTIFVNGNRYYKGNEDGTEVLLNGSILTGCDSTVNIDLTFFVPVVDTITQTLCSGSEIIVNGTTYNQENMTGDEVIENVAPNGCDSLIHINLEFGATVELNQDYNLCAGETVEVNGTTYGPGDDSGIENIPSVTGCDTIINVSVTAFPENNIVFAPFLCDGEMICINGTCYGQSPFPSTGVETLVGADVNNCDSVMQIFINFHPPVGASNETFMLCAGETIMIGGNQYGTGFPLSGSRTVEGVAANGCDSTYNFTVDFHPEARGAFNANLCTGGSIDYNGQTWDVNNTPAIDTVFNVAPNGCDSIIDINLSFFTPQPGSFNPTICEGTSIDYGGQTFNAVNDVGTVILPGDGLGGCDSTVNVMVSFHPPTTQGNYSETHCPGGSFVFEGVTFNINNQNQVINLGATSFNNCDTSVLVEIFFSTEPDPEDVFETLCPGETITIEGVTFSETFTEDIIELGTVGTGNCDSSIHVLVTFHPTYGPGNYSETKCIGGSFVYAGITFNSNNQSQTIDLGEVGENGCDSSILVQILFHDASPTGSYSQTECPGGSFVYNGITFNSNNTNQIVSSVDNDINGCDSMVNVSINFHDASPTGSYSQTECPGGSFIYNGITFNSNNTNQIVNSVDNDVNGCDSMVAVSINFHPEPTPGVFNPIICRDDSITFQNVIYHLGNPTGMATLTQASELGCDSTVNIQLAFYQEVVYDLDMTLCEGTTIIVNGTEYGEFPLPSSGSEIFFNASQNGCDSTVNIMLDFNTFVENNYSEVICGCEDRVFNNVTYNSCTNPMGIETLPGASWIGCDSIININLSSIPDAQFTFDPTLCPGETRIVNGTVYSETLRIGTETFINGSNNGCDSVVSINLSYHLEAINEINEILCDGESITINGTVYNTTTSLTDLLPAASYTGCDSSDVINIIVLPPVEVTINNMLCNGQELIVGDSLFNEANPDGIVVFQNASINGCDSTVFVDLSFAPFVSSTLDPTLCSDESVTVQGVVYDIITPTGTQTFIEGSIAGCDSIVNIDLSFFELVENNINDVLCAGASMMVGDSLFNQANPDGTVIFQDAAVNGCDSIVNVDLTFNNAITSSVSETLCEGESIMVAGELFETNFSGTRTIPSMASDCDSVITINLVFLETAINNLEPWACIGESVAINGIIYDIDNQTGLDTLMAASSNGCDSILSINLNFYPAATSDFSATLCEGGSIMVGDSLITAANANTIVIVTDGSTNGCDSTIMVDVNFMNAVTTDLTGVVCDGEVYTINEVDYSTSGMFTETIPNGSFMGCDSIIQLDLTVETAATLGLADAGEDVDLCGATSYILNGNLPSNSFGEWTTTSAATIDQPFEDTTAINDLSDGQQLFIWTLSTDVCANYDSDTIAINIGSSPFEATDDSFMLLTGENILEINLVENDDLNNITNWSIETTSLPSVGVLTEIGIGIYDYQTPLDYLGGDVSFSYEICDTDCPGSCKTAEVVIQIDEVIIDPDLTIPSGITPNGDGLNEALVIPEIELNPDRYTNAELTIFNRWGDVLYSKQPYSNDWGGTNNDGKALPQGTYYYVLVVDLLEGKIYKGDITILK